MGKFSTYRYFELRDDNSKPLPSIRTRSIKQPRKFRRIFLCLIVVALFGTYFMGLFTSQSRFLDCIAKNLGYQYDYHHAVIIDAGSSGTRVLAYRFRVPFTVFGPANLDLVEEYFEQSKPGLSSYANEPEKGAQTIVDLIKKAEFLIPASSRRNTPLLVRATAGLRLLPTDKADNLINHVQSAISKLGYDVGPKSVEIMNGADEGIFIWYTVNLLNNLMEGKTMAALDLGGGSTQITYQVTPKMAASLPASDLYTIPTGAYNITVYTHSYLKMGLLAARHGVFTTGVAENETKLSSVCVDPIVKDEEWIYANTKYIVSGASRPPKQKRVEAYEHCAAAVRAYVRSVLDWTPSEPPRAAVAAMSFYYDVAADAGIIDVMKGGEVTISQYKTHAIKACSASNIEQPWACIDLVYIATLLQNAYKMADHDRILLFKKVKGHEVSWALGLAYTTIMNRINVQ